jgi:hypothetical protein
MVPFMVLGSKGTGNIPQTLFFTDLSVQKNDELLPAGKVFNIFVGAISGN